jgi:tetratricopeptide (TPR) repeat protein
MTAGLVVATVLMGIGTFGVAMAQWVPSVRAARDPRTSIAATLSATIAASGIDQATRQYHQLKTAAPAAYNLAERELNRLGYQLLRQQKRREAIRVFQLNVEAYPRSSNVYDSLAEAYLTHDKKPEAIANYQKSLELNPKNRNAALMLSKLAR